MTIESVKYVVGEQSKFKDEMVKHGRRTHGRVKNCATGAYLSEVQRIASVQTWYC